MATGPGRRAGIYVRISLDPTGSRLGVTRQLRDCEAKATALGWTVAGVYEDNDTSASTTRPRPAYGRLLEDLEAGAVDAVVVWDLDRLTRRPIEIEHFIDLADRRGVALASVGGDVDLATDNGRLFARIKGAVARAEVDRKSTRQRSASDQRAELGRPSAGRRAFGYTADGTRVVPGEAAHVQAAAGRLLAGDSLHTITAHLNTAGAVTTAGNPWQPTQVRRMLANPRYAALRVHRGVVVGAGAWPPVLDVDTHRAVRAVLDDPARRAPGRPTASLLTGIATCAVCGDRVYATRSGARARAYYCRSRGHVTRAADPVDDYVTTVLLEHLTTRGPDLTATGPTGPATRDLRAREAALRARLDGLAEAYAAGDIDQLQMRAGSRRLRGDLDQVLTRLAAAQQRPVLASLQTAPDLQAAWDALSLDGQRTALAATLTVTLAPAGRGARRFNPETVRVAPVSTAGPRGPGSSRRGGAAAARGGPAPARAPRGG
jgi:DNA invertase Pin-like site-specific DNA recombinase